MLYRTLQWIVDEYDADYRENDKVFFYIIQYNHFLLITATTFERLSMSQTLSNLY